MTARWGAFHGDPALKQTLLAMIDAHVAAGTLTFDGPVWDGRSGSPLGIAVEGQDSGEYARRYGYPLPLAALLDLLMSHISDRPVALAATREWVDAVQPGADLSDVPTRLILAMLEPQDAGGTDHALGRDLVELHRRELTPFPAPRAEWSAVRQRVLGHGIPAEESLDNALLSLWEVAAWPATKGRSTLALTFSKWCHVRAWSAAGDWTPGDMARTHRRLDALWDEHVATREAGGFVDYPALLAAVEPELAQRYVTYLKRTNDRFLASGADLWRCCRTLFADAPVIAACTA